MRNKSPDRLRSIFPRSRAIRPFTFFLFMVSHGSFVVRFILFVFKFLVLRRVLAVWSWIYDVVLKLVFTSVVHFVSRWILVLWLPSVYVNMVCFFLSFFCVQRTYFQLFIYSQKVCTDGLYGNRREKNCLRFLRPEKRKKDYYQGVFPILNICFLRVKKRLMEILLLRTQNICYYTQLYSHV